MVAELAEEEESNSKDGTDDVEKASDEVSSPVEGENEDVVETELLTEEV